MKDTEEKDVLKGLNARVVSNYNEYIKGKEMSLPKRILMQVRAKDRAKKRLKRYGNLWAEVKDNISNAIEVEKDLQTKNLSSEEKAEFKDERDSYIDAVADKNEKMANTIVRAMKNLGYFGRARTEAFIANSKMAKTKGSKRLKLQKSVLLRIYTKLNPKYRKAEKMAIRDAKNYIMDNIDNLVDVDSKDNLIVNPEALSNISRRNVIKTIDQQPEIPNFKPVSAIDNSPSEPEVTPVDTSKKTTNKDPRSLISSWGKAQKKEEQSGNDSSTKQLLEEMQKTMQKLVDKVDGLTKDVDRLQKANSVLEQKISIYSGSSSAAYTTNPNSGDALGGYNPSVSEPKVVNTDVLEQGNFDMPAAGVGKSV